MKIGWPDGSIVEEAIEARDTDLARTDVTSVRKLAYAGAPMLAPLTAACVKAFQPRVFVNHYGSTEIYTFSVCADVHLKPGCAGRSGRLWRLPTASRVRSRMRSTTPHAALRSKSLPAKPKHCAL